MSPPTMRGAPINVDLNNLLCISRSVFAPSVGLALGACQLGACQLTFASVSVRVLSVGVVASLCALHAKVCMMSHGSA